MELVAATKMRRAVNQVLETRSYANRAWDVVKDLAERTDPIQHPLLRSRESVKRIAVVIMSSNRGLCGGFNREIVEKSISYIKGAHQRYGEVAVEVILLGKRATEIATKFWYPIVAEFQKADVANGIADISAAARMVIQDFTSGKYDLVTILYTDYFSALKQTPHAWQLLPIQYPDNELGMTKSAEEAKARDTSYEYLFEPSADEVLEQMLYRLIEIQIYQALLETNASEHSARMMSMRNASDAAKDMIEDLTLTFNRARQASITSEIADIAGGKAALE